MQKLFMYLIITASLFICNNNIREFSSADETVKPPAMSNHNSLSEQEKSDGWHLLFDGQSLTGWHKYGGTPAGAAWKVEDETLRLDASQMKNGDTTQGGDIVTDEEFENFHLKLEWRIDTGGNSGIMFYVHEDPQYKRTWHTGPEMQVLDNERHRDAKIIKHRAGDLYDLISSSKETVKPALEWNEVEIKAVNGKLEFWLNDVNVISTMMWDDNWKKMVANSKFAKMPGFGIYKKGRIALQDHGDNVWYRNIKIKSL